LTKFHEIPSQTLKVTEVIKHQPSKYEAMSSSSSSEKKSLKKKKKKAECGGGGGGGAYLSSQLCRSINRRITVQASLGKKCRKIVSSRPAWPT
jgi:hypothetical protein